MLKILLEGLLLADVNITSKGIWKCQSLLDLCSVGAEWGGWVGVGGLYLQLGFFVFVRKGAVELSQIEDHDVAVRHERECRQTEYQTKPWLALKDKMRTSGCCFFSWSEEETSVAWQGGKISNVQPGYRPLKRYTHIRFVQRFKRVQGFPPVTKTTDLSGFSRKGDELGDPSSYIAS